MKCFHYIVMEGQVMEVMYRVKNMEQNTEPTIDFLFVGSIELVNRMHVNSKSGGLQIQSKVGVQSEHSYG